MTCACACKSARPFHSKSLFTLPFAATHTLPRTCGTSLEPAGPPRTRPRTVSERGKVPSKIRASTRFPTRTILHSHHHAGGVRYANQSGAPRPTESTVGRHTSSSVRRLLHVLWCSQRHSEDSVHRRCARRYTQANTRPRTPETTHSVIRRRGASASLKDSAHETRTHRDGPLTPKLRARRPDTTRVHARRLSSREACA